MGGHGLGPESCHRTHMLWKDTVRLSAGLPGPDSPRHHGLTHLGGSVGSAPICNSPGSRAILNKVWS